MPPTSLLKVESFTGMVSVGKKLAQPLPVKTFMFLVEFYFLCLPACLLGPDLCASKQPLCSHNSLCINTLGSYSCVCQHGYYDVSSVTERAPASHPVCQGTETSHQSLKPMYFILKAHPFKKNACVVVQLLIFVLFFWPSISNRKRSLQPVSG